MHRLAADRDPGCLLDTDGAFLFVNDAWERFAQANGGGSRCTASALIGTRMLDHVTGDAPRRMLRHLLERALRARVTQTSECNGPDVARLVAAQLEPVTTGAGAPVGIAVVYRVVRERPIGDVYPLEDATSRSWRGPAGLEQCSTCRRTRRPDVPDEWDLVPGLVAAPPRDTQFGCCPRCLALHHGETAAEATRASSRDA